MTYKYRLSAADAAVRCVQDIIDDASRSVGAPELVGTFLIACHLNGGGRDLVLQRDLQPCEGSGDMHADIKAAFVGETMTNEARAHVRRYALEQARAVLRQRALHNERAHHDPTWSFDANVILHEIIRQGGLAAEMFAISDVANWDKHRSVVPGDRIEMPWGSVSCELHQVSSGFLTPTMVLRTGGGEAVICLDRDSPYVMLEDSYPDTVAQAATGRTLMEVMPHPLFEGLPPMRVTRMVSGPEMTLVNFEAITAPLAPMPDQIDPAWMKLPAHKE